MPGADEAPSRKKKLIAARLNDLARPRFLFEMAGQKQVIDNLRIQIEAAKKRHEPLDHILLHGASGLGKTTFAHVISNEMQANIHLATGLSIRNPSEATSLITRLRESDILFIDEIHRLRPAVEEVLGPAMEDFALDIVIGKGSWAKTLRVNLPRFTVIGATTQQNSLSISLQSRFGAVYRLAPYDLPAMIQIVRRMAGMLEIPIDDEGIRQIAQQARGIPRAALRLLSRVRDFAEVRADGVITGEIAFEALNFLANHDSSEL